MTRRDEHDLASFFARPEFVRIRPLLKEISPSAVEKIDLIVRKVRLEQWGDFSSPEEAD